MTREPIILKKIGIRDLIHFMVRSGNLGRRRPGAATSALEGLRGHQRLQKARPEGYEAEVPVSYTHEKDGYSLEVRGRIDGVFTNKDPVVIEEIKTTRLPLDEVPQSAQDMAALQGRMYAWIYAQTHDLQNLAVRVTWVNIDTYKIASHEEKIPLEQLNSFFPELVEGWMEWAIMLYQWEQKRNQSIAELAFPFPNYRTGQRRFAAEVYRTVRDKQLLFAQAPTGIGKTMATLFPAVKAMGEDRCEKLFFLTARTTGAGLAEQALVAMRSKGLQLRAVTLTARDKVCFEAPSCNVETCPYAIGYFDRLKPALKEALDSEELNREQMVALARKHTLCPFELSLELAEWSDVVIGDYNYAFDPAVHLRRFFGENKHPHVLLIDEAHNLVDRARDMYSALLDKRTVMSARRAVLEHDEELAKRLNSINRALLKRRKTMDGDQRIDSNLPQDLLPSMGRFCAAMERLFAENGGEHLPEAVLEIFFDVLRFMRTAELFGDSFVTLERAFKKDYNIRLYCLDPSPLLARFLDKSRAAIFFSATLTPFPYFVRLLAGETERSRVMRLASPFPAENLCATIIPQISTRFKHREAGLEPIARIIERVAGVKTGNYLVFFPSYAYMNAVSSLYRGIAEDVEILEQQSGMSEEDRQHFLDSFQKEEDRTRIGFAVMGGIFGEGIDLTGDRLIGVIVVGVGLPALCLERDLIRDHFNNRGEDGFTYAYQYPGMNRVLQTAGRVIRTETDRGVVCLIGDRFTQTRYMQMFPAEWQPYIAGDQDAWLRHLDRFWTAASSEKGDE